MTVKTDNMQDICMTLPGSTPMTGPFIEIVHTQSLTTIYVWAPPEGGCFVNSDHRMMKLEFEVTWTARGMKELIPNKPDRMLQAKWAMTNATEFVT